MRNKIITILLLLGLCVNCWGQNKADFVRAYLLVISEGRAFYSVYGHSALRLVCKEKELDYCFTFEMDMNKSSYIEVFTRKAKAGFAPVPTGQFLDQYRQEGRGVKAYELNLTLKEKQKLWKVLDEEAMNGSVWTFDYTSVNCLSMVMYAINKAIAPNQVKFAQLPQVVKGDVGDWMDYVSRRSPWVRIVMHSVLRNVQDEEVKPEDLLTPEMMESVMQSTKIKDAAGGVRNFSKGKPVILMAQTYNDQPCWFKPWMALCLLLLLIVMAIWFCRKRTINKKKAKGNSIKKKTYGNKNK